MNRNTFYHAKKFSNLLLAETLEKYGEMVLFHSGSTKKKAPLSKLNDDKGFETFVCARNRNRTCTTLRSLVPETSASASFAIRALLK